MAASWNQRKKSGGFAIPRRCKEVVINPAEMRQRAIRIFEKRFHCSQTILVVGQERMNVVHEEVTKATGLFGGGIAGSGNICGCLVGGVALISSIYSRGNLNEKEDPNMWQLGKRLVKKFEELTKPFGGTNCRDIARVDWTDKAAVKYFWLFAVMCG